MLLYPLWYSDSDDSGNTPNIPDLQAELKELNDAQKALLKSQREKLKELLSAQKDEIRDLVNEQVASVKEKVKETAGSLSKSSVTINGQNITHAQQETLELLKELKQDLEGFKSRMEAEIEELKRQLSGE